MNRRIYLQLPLLGFLVFAVSCEPHEVTDLQEHIEYYNRRIIRFDHNLERDLAKEDSLNERLRTAKEKAKLALQIRDSIEQMQEEKRTMIAGLPTMEAEIAAQVALLAAYRASFQPKYNYEEVELGDLNLPNGETYRNAEIQSALENGLNIRHANGFVTVPYEELPSSIDVDVVLAPEPVDSTLDPESVLLRRPDFLKSEEELEDEREAAWRLSQEVKEEEMEQRHEEIRKQQRQRELEAADFQKRLHAYNKKYRDLQEEIRIAEASLSAQIRRKNEADSEMRNSAIAVAARDRESKLKVYDRQISALEAEVARLRSMQSKLERPR